MSTPVWIGLGSNLGDRKAILDAAVAALADAPGVAVRAVSSYHETLPVGGPPDQGPFLNAAASLNTSLDPHQLLAVMQEIENRAGRVRKVRWGERTLDLDILIYGCKFLDTPRLKLPHPRLALRRFVLAPLAEIAPTIVDTMTGRTIADLLASFDRGPRLVAIEGPRGSLKSEVFRRLVDELPAVGIVGEEAALEQVHAPPPGHSESYLRKAEALRADRWAAETFPVKWLLADYCLDLDRIKNSPNYLASLHFEKITPGPILRPLFAVLLPSSTWQSGPRLVSIPLLRPESTDPDAIVDEVLATCRAIEGA
jgi:2-amino-4-hydroxy-6-hydroxymethyldihydropteridine diphosphokinase